MARLERMKGGIRSAATRAVARNISDGGMLIETPAPLPMGSIVNVHFQVPGNRAHIRAVAEVKNQYALNYCGDDGEFRSARGMGLRFLAFLDGAEDALGENLGVPETLH